jgi:hypothetical protein
LNNDKIYQSGSHSNIIFNGSIVWKDPITMFPLVGEWMIWNVENGRNICKGDDPPLGLGMIINFPNHYFNCLEIKMSIHLVIFERLSLNLEVELAGN